MTRRWPMRTAVTIGGGLALLVLALGAAGQLLRADGDGWIGNDATARPGVRHAALHINCPPGSHGVPRYAKFGQSLGYGRDGAATTSRLRDRSLTAAVPPRTPSNP